MKANLKKTYNEVEELLKQCIHEFEIQGYSCIIKSRDSKDLRKLLKQLKKENRNELPTVQKA